jgi:hypothetical protein
MGTKIYNSELSTELREGAKIQQGIDPTPSELADKVIAVMEVNPKLLRNIEILASAATTGTGASTIMTTPRDKDIYVTEITLGIIKDVLCDVATGTYAINTTINGVSRPLVNTPILTLTAQNQNLVISFSRPIKLDRNVTIALASASSTAGIFNRSTIIFGYYVENINA